MQYKYIYKSDIHINHKEKKRKENNKREKENRIHGKNASYPSTLVLA